MHSTITFGGVRFEVVMVMKSNTTTDTNTDTNTETSEYPVFLMCRTSFIRSVYRHIRLVYNSATTVTTV
jgi:hypothetical protein